MLITGIEKAYIAVNTLDTAAGLTYGTPVYYEGIQSYECNPKINPSVQHGENRVLRRKNTFDSADINLALAQLTSAQKAALLGQHIASIGGVYAKSDDSAPYVALLYKATIEGGYRYGVFYKGMFTVPKDSAKTQEGKTEYQSPQLTASFDSTIYNKMWEYHVDTTDPNCPVDVDSTWFNAVVIPEADTVAPTLTSVPANNATGVTVSSTVVVTFSKVMDESTITLGNIFLTTAAGVLVACTIALDATKKIATLTPTSNMGTGVHLAIVTKDVKSATGVNLAATSIIKFTVA
ncbi:MAG: hypothetical protein A2Y15_08720 [Clostridiales bacterium GWF2_36_10]|nr:MAG: hypothetical protein A2Y15_08720 [Clostridiales bacterium GWF2_36_10]HAN20426.1 hypothetical protein [Clostridiales bacterium]